ncbi:MAG: Acyl-CoA dehydrogenase C-terminal domain-containing protein, partial [Bacteroidales bacterium]|nr:Acyl-CoA dehydrogenase C-terminal domain-containing protein [Bacteroidales bacterium]
LDFAARKLVEMATLIIMAYLMLHDASKNSALFGSSAQVFLRYAETEVDKHSLFIERLEKDDLGFYRK